MEFYAAVRRSVYVEGLSERAAARRFGLARETVRKMLRYRLPPGYRRAKPIRCPKLDAFTGVIDQILTDDQQRPKKQRHTAKRIWERLCVEHAFTGGYTIEPLAKRVIGRVFPCRRRRGEGRSAGGMQRSQDGSDRAREAGDTGVHGACLPVMRASAREERWRISFTSRSSLRLFSIHSR